MTQPRPLLSPYLVRPWAELGLGDTRQPVGQAVWDRSRWDQADATWAGTEPTWLDVSCEVIDAHVTRGRDRMIDRFVPAGADIVLRNVDGWADLQPPPHPPATLPLRPGRQLRWGVDTVTGRHVLSRGFVDEAIPLYQPYGLDVVQVNTVDALGEAGRAMLEALEAAVGEGETADVRVARVLDAVGWPTSYRSVQATSIALQGTELGAQAIDVMGEAAESSGGAVFGGLDARLCYRAKDWETYPPEVPPAATIGNVEAGHWEPGTPAVPQVDGYMNCDGVRIVSAVDAANLNITGDVRFTARVRDTSSEAAVSRYVAAHGSGTDLAWYFGSTYSNTFYGGLGYPGGTSASQVAPSLGTRTVWGLTPPGADRYIGATFRGVTPGVSAATLVFRGITSSDGVTWSPLGLSPAAVRGDALSRDAAQPLRIGVGWLGRIYWAQLESLDAAGNPTGVLWRFDANDYPASGGGLTYTDPRGRTWTLSAAAAIVPKVPAVPPGPPVWVPPDVCPSMWELSWRRRDVAAYVRMGRSDGVYVAVTDDEAAVVIGPEPFVRDDLVTLNTADLDLIANRALETRGMATMPRIEAVTLDAARDPGDGTTVELMATAAPETPTRVRCRLQTRTGRPVFDVDMFVTGVDHTITDTGRWWTRLTLDVAAPYAAPGGRWDQARWDRATWGVAV